MNKQNFIKAFKYSFRLIVKITLSVTIFVLVPTIYFIGLIQGYSIGKYRTELAYSGLIDELSSVATSFEIVNEPVPTKAPPATNPNTNSSLIRDVGWGGPDLWIAVNNKRTEYGVNPLSTADELCTIASIRLNDLLALGSLDGHEGFGDLSERRPDLAWIFNSYSTIAEFLLAGADTPDEAVSLWDNSMGHKKLLTGGEYVWGCIYAQNSFAVAITAF